MLSFHLVSVLQAFLMLFLCLPLFWPVYTLIVAQPREAAPGRPVLGIDGVLLLHSGFHAAADYYLL